MTLLALLSLAFSGWMASLREARPSGWRDFLSTAWIAAGSLAGMLTAVVAVSK